jgi:hypothetical protein
LRNPRIARGVFEEPKGRPDVIAALRDPQLRTVAAEDQSMVLRLLADRHQDLTRLRTQAICRLHALLAALSAGGVAGARFVPDRITRQGQARGSHWLRRTAELAIYGQMVG